MVMVVQMLSNVLKVCRKYVPRNGRFVAFVPVKRNTYKVLRLLPLERFAAERAL